MAAAKAAVSVPHTAAADVCPRPLVRALQSAGRGGLVAAGWSMDAPRRFTAAAGLVAAMWRGSAGVATACGGLVQRFLAAGVATRAVGSSTAHAAATSTRSNARAAGSAAAAAARPKPPGGSSTGLSSSPGTSSLIADLVNATAARSSSTLREVGGAGTATSKRLLSMLTGTINEDDPVMAMQLDIRTVDEELMAYLCLQKLMKVYEEDHFTPAEKIAQLLSDSMNVVPGLHHTLTKRLGRFINLRGEDSLRARTRFRKDMRKLLQGNLACPDYMIFLMQRLWHSSHWNHDDVLVHEAQANLQSIWIPELKTLFKVLRWENQHFHGERASVDELIHRVVVAHKFISGRLPRRAQLGLYQKLAKFHSQQTTFAGVRPLHGNTKLPAGMAAVEHDTDAADDDDQQHSLGGAGPSGDDAAAPGLLAGGLDGRKTYYVKKQKKKKKKRQNRRRQLRVLSVEPTSVLDALAPVLQSPRYRKVQSALAWIFGSVGDGSASPSDDLLLERLTPMAKTLVRIKLYLDKFDDSAEMAKLYEAGELGQYEGVSDAAPGTVPFDLPRRPAGYDDETIHNSATGQMLSRYSTHEAARIIAAERMEAEERNWVYRARSKWPLISIEEVVGGVDDQLDQPARHGALLDAVDGTAAGGGFGGKAARRDRAPLEAELQAGGGDGGGGDNVLFDVDSRTTVEDPGSSGLVQLDKLHDMERRLAQDVAAATGSDGDGDEDEEEAAAVRSAVEAAAAAAAAATAGGGVLSVLNAGRGVGGGGAAYGDGEFVNPELSIIVSNLRADFSGEDLEAAFGGLGTVRSAHVFGNRIFSVPLLSKEEIMQHIVWEHKAVTTQKAVAKAVPRGGGGGRPAPSKRAAQVLDGSEDSAATRGGSGRGRGRPGGRRNKKPKATLADSLLQLEAEKMHRVYGLVEFTDREAVERLCCDSLMLFGSYINGRMCPVINSADQPYSIVVHNLSLAVARCEVDQCLNSILPPPLRIEVMRSCAYNWFETQKSVRIRYPNFLQALAAKTVLDGQVLKGRRLAADWDVSVPSEQLEGVVLGGADRGEGGDVADDGSNSSNSPPAGDNVLASFMAGDYAGVAFP